LYNTYLNANAHFSTINSDEEVHVLVENWWDYVDVKFHQENEIEWSITNGSINAVAKFGEIDAWNNTRNELSFENWMVQGLNLESNIIDYYPELTIQDLEEKKALLMTISAFKYHSRYWFDEQNGMVLSTTVTVGSGFPAVYASWDDCMFTTFDLYLGDEANGLSVVQFMVNFGGGPGGSVVAAAAGCAYLTW